LVYYAAGVAVLASALKLGQWLAGDAPLPAAMGPEMIVFSFYPVYFIALLHYLDRQAKSALEAFRPALGATDAEYALIEYELTTVPARGAWIAAALAIPLGFLFILPGESGSLSPRTLPLQFLAVLYTIFTVGSFFVLAFHTVRQLRRVSQLHAAARTINLLQPRPTYAFSRLTSRTAVGVLAFLYLDFLINPPTEGVVLPYFTFTGVAVVLMVAAFLLPLLGMHQRLTREKARLEAEVNHGVENAYQELQRLVRAKAYARVGDVEKALSSMLRMRDVIGRLSTWPWQPETLRGVLAAVGLPIALWLIQFGLSRLLG
jgi:hypothetical protein